MSNTKHTPGPWIIEQPSSFNQIGDRLIIRAEKPEENLWDQICEVGRDGYLLTGLMGGTAIDNAALIASAPSLLKENEIMKTALKNIAVGSSDPDHLESIATEALKLISSSKS